MRWGIVSTIAEPPPLVYAFVAHYAALGAAQIDIHLDAPDPALADRLVRVPGCRVFQKTARDWVRAGHFGPPSPPRRQALNAAESYGRAEVDWLLHVDADEFLTDAARVLESLQQMPDTAMFLSLTPIERVLVEGEPDSGIFDGVFRRLVPPARQEELAPIYGDAARFLDFGFSSNGQPKSFCRTGAGLRMGVHEPRGVDGGRVSGQRHLTPGLLHFDGLTEAHYLAKLDRRISQEVGWRRFPAAGRQAQMLALYQARGDGAARSGVYAAIKRLTPAQADRLTALALLERRVFDPGPAIAQVFPEMQIDLSCSHFDSHTLREMALPWHWRLWKEIRARSYGVRRVLWPRRDPGAH